MHRGDFGLSNILRLILSLFVMMSLAISCVCFETDETGRVQVTEMAEATEIVEMSKVGSFQEEYHSVSLGGADSVRVSIGMRTGEMSISSGSDDLLNAVFLYNVAEWKPDIDYRVEEGQGDLAIKQPNEKIITLKDDVVYQWNLGFDETAVTDLSVKLGACEAKLDLDNTSLVSLDINSGAGDLNVNLTGNQSLKRLDLRMGAGNAILDLRGDWNKDMVAKIQNGIGTTTLKLPINVGVSVTPRSGLGTITYEGLRREDNRYVNEAQDQSDITLYIEIDSGAGNIVLEG